MQTGNHDFNTRRESIMISPEFKIIYNIIIKNVKDNH